MKTIVHISVSISGSRLTELWRIDPTYVRPPMSYRAELDHNDPRLKQILDLLHGWGYRLWSGNASDMDLPRQYDMTYMREYDAADLDAAEYLTFIGSAVDSIGVTARDAVQRLQLDRPTLKSLADFELGSFDHVLVPRRVYEMLSAQAFRHLVFVPTVLVRGTGSYPARQTVIPWGEGPKAGPWWELTSDLFMPPLSPTVELRTMDGQMVKPGSSIGCPREGLYNRAELHYRRSDLMKMPSFDVALSFERWGHTHYPDGRSTVVSKRFYDFCITQGLKGDWAPVRIDEHL